MDLSCGKQQEIAPLSLNKVWVRYCKTAGSYQQDLPKNSGAALSAETGRTTDTQSAIGRAWLWFSGRTAARELCCLEAFEPQPSNTGAHPRKHALHCVANAAAGIAVNVKRQCKFSPGQLSRWGPTNKYTHNNHKRTRADQQIHNLC